MKALAVGCFWLSARESAYRNEPAPLEQAHISKMKEALENVDNVSNVSIIGNGGVIYNSCPFDDSDCLPFPHYVFLSLHFSLYLPKRLQEQYGMGLCGDCGATLFNVSIIYKYDMPVAYIHYDLPEGTNHENSNPAGPVKFIREYLADKLKNDSYCKLECLGPSPFHADILLDLEEGECKGISSENLSPNGPGYTQLLFHIALVKNAAWLEDFLESHHDILALYYYLVRCRNAVMHRDAAILGAVQDIFKNESFWLLSVFRTKSLVNFAYKMLIEGQLSALNAEEHLAERLQQEALGEANAFFPFIRKEMERKSGVPFTEVRDLLTIAEGRRLKIVENFSVLFSALVGGILGALLTYFLSLPQESPKPIFSLNTPFMTTSPAVDLTHGLPMRLLSSP